MRTETALLRPYDALVADLGNVRNILLCVYRGVKYTISRLAPGNVVINLRIPKSDVADFATEMELSHDGSSYILDGANEGEYPKIGPEYWLNGTIENVEDGLVYRSVGELDHKCRGIIDLYLLLSDPIR